MSFLASLPRLRDFRRGHFHDLRRSQATELYSQAFIGKVAQERLGHPTVTTPLDL
jgi:integrase